VLVEPAMQGGRGRRRLLWLAGTRMAGRRLAQMRGGGWPARRWPGRPVLTDRRKQAERVPVPQHPWRGAEALRGFRNAHGKLSYNLLSKTAYLACDPRRTSRNVGVSS
jgi:hypothetical protein